MTRSYQLCVGTLLLNLTLAMLGAAEPKRVLIVHSFGSAAPPFTTHSVAFETELTEKMGGRVDLDEVSLDMARYADPEMQDALVEYIQKRQAKWQPDLVVPIGSPAGVFVAQYRDRLFPEMPIIYTGMDKRRLPPGALQKNATLVGEDFNLAGFVEDILQVAPATTNIVLVIGATPLEQFWMEAFRRGFEPFTNRISFTWLNELPFDQMLERVSRLPPRSFIFVVLLLRDASGVTHNVDEALKRIHAVANAPVNSIFQHQLGLGIVGGRLYQAELEGVESASIAIRVLHGEPVSSIPPKIVEPLPPRYDWRELQRWNISESRLPPGSEVRFHTPTFWEEYKWHLIGICLVILAEAALIVWLVRSRRRVTELARDLKISESQLLKGRADLNDQLRFERLSTDISSTLMHAPVEELGKQIVPALGQMAQMLGFDAVSLWLLTGKDTALRAHGWHKPDSPGLPANLAEKDFPWSVGELFAGRDVQIGALDDFPPEAQTDRATAERYGLKSLWAVPMEVRSAKCQVSAEPDTSHLTPRTFLGALSMGSFREELSVSPQLVQRQRVLANVFGNALVRARAEIALRESEKRLTLAATAGDLGLWLWDLPTNVLWATERAKKMFGFAPESELTYEMFYGRVHPEDRPAVDAGIAGAISGKANYETQYRICLPDGAEKWIASRGEVAFEDGGQPVSVTGVVSDITERHVSAMELSRNRQELAHVARVSTMGELAASVAHELNQPLGAILANAEAAELFLQQNPPMLDELRAILADIRKDDERAGEVIRRMRALLRKHELERQPIEINSLVEDVLQLVSGDASLRGVSLSADLRSALPKVSGDRIHLQQVLLNLILNGMDAMAGEPRERRRITARTRLGGEGTVELAVIDAGHGIEPEKLPRLFEPFYTTKPHGMGMGLSIAHTIITAHHGRIWAENNSTGGAVFHITLPAAEKEQGSGLGIQDSGKKE